MLQGKCNHIPWQELTVSHRQHLSPPPTTHMLQAPKQQRQQQHSRRACAGAVRSVQQRHAKLMGVQAA